MFDVIIAGAGLTGMVSALAFADNGFSVAIVEPKQLSTSEKTKNYSNSQDFRSTAHLPQTVDFLRNLGAWQQISDNACSLQRLDIINKQQMNYFSEPQTKTEFVAKDVGREELGFNVPIQDSFYGLAKMIASNENINILMGVKIERFTPMHRSIMVFLSDKTKIEGRLLIGADGGHSRVRELAGINVFKKNTGQTAITFNIRHEKPHYNSSTEIYSAGGPLTLVPLKKMGENSSSAVVWMQNSEDAEKLLSLDLDKFIQEVQKHSNDVTGNIQSCSERGSKKVVIQVASQIIGPRVALVGEASHLLPPIGAQGFNLSVKDISVIVRIASKNKQQLGNHKMLLEYQRERLADIFIKTAGVGALNFLAWSENPVSQISRASGLKFIQNFPSFCQNLIRLGLR